MTNRIENKRSSPSLCRDESGSGSRRPPHAQRCVGECDGSPGDDRTCRSGERCRPVHFLKPTGAASEKAAAVETERVSRVSESLNLKTCPKKIWFTVSLSGRCLQSYLASKNSQDFFLIFEISSKRIRGCRVSIISVMFFNNLLSVYSYRRYRR